MTADHRNRYMLDAVIEQDRQARAMWAAHPRPLCSYSRAIPSGPSSHIPGDAYTCPELLPTNNRPGAFDNLACPSLIAGRRVLPRQFESHRHVINPALHPKD
ncbi:MAG: hypothetical protein GAK30_01547 [Paracidovorax wautersii]|uniref:Uncharacterized protein n=1 Tax=Paracidovorax wautersii TaxID=1177982 RepID=A0A7V8FPN9_9BURK|nr:MAG: hypothetical protein GAK30_01547 [Paracidovorax wautersii]